jgi:FtsP/CotA-like multicopper oxidase with cupredoxin domain
MKRRDFVKYAGGGLAALVVGSEMPAWISNNSLFAVKQVQELSYKITDALKDMVTHNENTKAQSYFWLYKEANFPEEIPGPHIFTTEGSLIKVSITNGLDEPHAFFIPGMVNSGPIAPGATKNIQFVA